MAIGEPSGECYEKIKLHSNHLLDYYDPNYNHKLCSKYVFGIKEI